MVVCPRVYLWKGQEVVGSCIYFEGRNSNTLATWYEELTHLKIPWCWERVRTGGEGDDREWDSLMASPAQWMWVWVNSGSWWWTGRPDMLWFMGSQKVGHNWATELNWDQHDFLEFISPPKLTFPRRLEAVAIYVTLLIHRLLVKQIPLHQVGGSHPISWKLLSGREFCSWWFLDLNCNFGSFLSCQPTGPLSRFWTEQPLQPTSTASVK